MKKLIVIVLLCYFQSYLVTAQSEDRWYILTIGARHSGYFHEATLRSDSIVTNQTELHIRISRLGSETVLDAKQFATEDRRGNLKDIASELLYSKQLNVSKVTIRPGAIRITSEAGGKQSTRDLSHSGKLIGSEGIRLLTNENLKKPGDSSVSTNKALSQERLWKTCPGV